MHLWETDLPWYPVLHEWLSQYFSWQLSQDRMSYLWPATLVNLSEHTSGIVQK